MMLNLGLLGQTLSHSLSVPIHEMFFDRIGAQDSYRLIELAPGHVLFLREIMKARALDGLNVTIPYKQTVMPLMDELTSEAQCAGAVNTILLRCGRLIGHNTDLYGFDALLRENGIEIGGKTCALLGATGGAARAVAHVLAARGAKKLLMVSRTPGAHDAAPDVPHEWLDYAALAHVSFDVLVNCTPVGMRPNIDVSPVPDALAARADALIDLIYNPPETRFLLAGRAARRTTVNGLYMLIAQAVASEAFWRGADIDVQAERAIYARMREGF